LSGRLAVWPQGWYLAPYPALPAEQGHSPFPFLSAGSLFDSHLPKTPDPSQQAQSIGPINPWIPSAFPSASHIHTRTHFLIHPIRLFVHPSVSLSLSALPYQSLSFSSPFPHILITADLTFSLLHSNYLAELRPRLLSLYSLSIIVPACGASSESRAATVCAHAKLVRSFCAAPTSICRFLFPLFDSSTEIRLHYTRLLGTRFLFQLPSSHLRLRL
jgi:hypothetical protein